MAADLTLEDEESPKKALLNVCLVLASTFAFFLFFSVFLFELVHWFVFRNEATDAHLFVHGNFSIWEDPLRVFGVYASWWASLVNGISSGDVPLVLLVPLIAPLLSIYVLYFAFMKTSYSFNFWYILNHHFAKLADVEKMGLHKGILLVLGRFHNYILGVNRPSNVLCIGETGTGKTSSVAIPSILRSDNVSVLAVDNTGALVRNTSGHRAEIGKVFYFNWDLPDDEDKGIYYPKWNPLSIEALPAKGKKRDDYLRKVATHLVLADDEEHDESNYWYWLSQNTMTTMLGFLIEKISQAMANDYFLDRILEKNSLKKEDREALLSYYLSMPEEFVSSIVEKLKNSASISVDDYVPIGSWEGIPDSWKGKDLCLGMLTDWLLHNYLTSKDGGDWRKWLETLIVEAGLFNYSADVVQGLERFLYLSRQQRQIVFVCMVRPLKSFINQIIREKTSLNDIDIRDFRGLKNSETGKLEPVTIYVSANTRSSKFVCSLFVELMLGQGIVEGRAKGAFPLLVVWDDVGQMLKVPTLAEVIAKGTATRTSFLLLCNSLNNIENTYTKEILEKIVSYSNYKIVMAEDNKRMSRQLKKLALFATKSVQISLDNRRSFQNKKVYTDANYFHRLAKDFEVNQDLRIKTRDYQVILVEGYYNRPILARNIHYLRDDKFKSKALKEAVYGLDDQLLALRNLQDAETPTIDEVLENVDLGIDDEIELKQFMNMAYDEAKSKMPEESDRNSVLASDISDKWSGEKVVASEGEVESLLTKSEKPQNASQAQDDWWLEENSFDVKEAPQGQNPFAKK